MTQSAFVEHDDHWELPLAGMRVIQGRYDYAFTLLLGARGTTFTIRVEQDFTLFGADDSQLNITPEESPGSMAATLDLVHSRVTMAMARRNGQLDIEFDNGSELCVPFSDTYEAWEIVGPNWLRMVSLAGGDLAIWTGDGTEDQLFPGRTVSGDEQNEVDR